MTEFLRATPLLPAGPDLDAAVRFFVDELGFEVRWQGGSMAGVGRGQVEFNLVQNSDRRWAENASVSIAVDGLESLYAAYRGCSAGVGPLERKVWGRREFHMILPSGVCLQFYQGEEADPARENPRQ
jgi:catechol 2,3-dioxygenase-like lactoylglutathione lyase family enzyme